MPTDYTPEDWEAGDTFTPEQATAMSAQINEEEGINTAQQADLATRRLKYTAAQTIREFSATAGSPVYLANQPIPAGAIGVRLTLIPAGPGGGSGRRGAAGTVRGGGGGGANHRGVRDLFIPVGASTSYLLAVGAPGVGGAAVTTDDTNGNDGGVAGDCAFKLSAEVQWTVLSGTTLLPGHGGTNAGATGGSTTLPSATASGGSAAGTGTAGAAGGESFWTDSPPGAGAGGGITAANVPSAGGNGGQSRLNIGVGGAGGVVGGALPTSGAAAPVAARIGPAPGGGAASITAAAQAGADGVAYGAPGGGGGASLNGFASGKGGNGGPGYARLEWVFG